MKIVITAPAGTGHSTDLIRDSLHKYGSVLREDNGKPEFSIMSQWAEVEDLGDGAYRVTVTVPGWAQQDARAVLEAFGRDGAELAEKPSGVRTPIKSAWITVED